MMEIYKVTTDFVAALNTVTSNVFPMLAPQGTSLPFITYEHTGFTPQGSKDCEYEVTITYNIHIITKSYNDGLQYVDAIRAALYGITSQYHYTYEYEIISASEVAYDDGYEQTMVVSLTASKQ